MNGKCCIVSCENDAKEVFDGKKYCGKHRIQIRRYGLTIERTRFDSNEIIIYDSYAEIILYYKSGIEKGRTKIDLDDVDKCKKYKWFKRTCDGKEYAMTRINRKSTRLHRYILDFWDTSLDIDHKDGDGLNNRKDNLRVVTHQQNMMNQRIVPSNNTSGFIGITQNRQSKSWIAQIKINGKRIYLGSFINIEDAIECRKQAELKYFGKNKLSNFENEDN